MDHAIKRHTIMCSNNAHVHRLAKRLWNVLMEFGVETNHDLKMWQCLRAPVINQLVGQIWTQLVRLAAATDM